MSTARRRRRSPIVIAIGMLVVGLLLGAAVVWVIVSRPFYFGGQLATHAGQPGQSFAINGDLSEPVSPGGSVPLDLSISNPLDSDLTVFGLHVEVVAVDAPNATALLPCGVHDFAVRQLSGHDELVVRAGGTSTLTELGVPREAWPRVLMRDTASNQDGCKGASFSLGYSAAGRIVE